MVTKLHMHGKKIGKLDGLLIIKLGKRVLRIIMLIINHRSRTVTLDDHQHVQSVEQLVCEVVLVGDVCPVS